MCIRDSRYFQFYLVGGSTRIGGDYHGKLYFYFLIAVLLFGGAYSCYQMSKLDDPEIKVKLAMIVTTYPGDSAHQVELEVTDVLEKNIRTMGNIDNIESYSYNDLSPVSYTHLHSFVAVVGAGLLFGIGYGIFDANNMPILCQFVSSKHLSLIHI